MKAIHLTSPLAKSATIVRLQNLLKNHGWYSGERDGQYGPLTAQGVYRAKYRLGYRRPDQVAGPRLLGYLDGTRKQTPAMKARAALRKRRAPVHRTKGHLLVQYALTQVGVKESPAGSNRQKYGVWYGANGLPWCAMFLSYCANKVSLPFRYAYVPFVVADARAGKNGLSLVHPSDVFQGCFVCYDWTHDGTADHIGVFEKWVDKDKGLFATVEGNTSPDDHADQSNGGEVCHKTTRSVSSVQAFVELHGTRR